MYYYFFELQQLQQKNLQCISSFTEVEAGTEMLLLLAWQVKMEWRSVLRNCTSLSSLVTLPETSSTTSDTSSSRAWSRHHVTLGVGRPERKELEKFEYLGWSPAILTSDDFIRSNEIIRTKWPIYVVIGHFVLTI